MGIASSFTIQVGPAEDLLEKEVSPVVPLPYFAPQQQCLVITFIDPEKVNGVT